MTEPRQRSSADSRELPFQKRVVNWLMACFSMEICRDGVERNHRFLEEALELVQSLDCTRSEAHQLVDYVFNRPVGEPQQELGGTLVTLTALANCHDMDMMEAGEIELARVWTKIDKIRAKQAAKPKHSPLPEHVPTDAQRSWEPLRQAFEAGFSAYWGPQKPEEVDGFLRDMSAAWSDYADDVLSAARPPAAPAPDQAWRDSDWLGLSASEKACYHWPDDTDLHRQCRAAYVSGATDYARPPAAPVDLTDPVVVHVNMLRGTIAKPTWEQIKHLYPEQFQSSAGNVDVIKAAIREHFKGIGNSAVTSSDGIERVYYSGFSLVKLAESVAAALTAAQPQTVRETEAYRETVRRIAESRERRLAQLCEVLDKIIETDQRESFVTIETDPAGNTMAVKMVDGPCAALARAALALTRPDRQRDKK